MRTRLKSAMKTHMTRAVAVLLVAGLFLALSYRIYKVDYFEVNPDEGLNAMKASLMLRGYPLYSGIWSDQPPVYTLLLAVVFRLFGEEITLARIVDLAASFAIFWGVWDILKRNGGLGHAIFGVLIVILLPFYINLSVSAMVGLPSIALAMLSLSALMRWHDGGDPWWLVISGVLLGLSIMTKLFTGLLVPVFAFGVLAGSWKAREGAGRFGPAVIWISACGVTALCILFFFVGWDNVQMLFSDHIKARGIMRTDGTSFGGVMRKNREFTIALMALAGIGLGLSLRHGRRVMIYPFLWGALALGLLWNHAPFWYHQTPLFTVPSAILGGFACGEAAGLIRNRFVARALWEKAMALAVIALLAVMIAGQGPKVRKSINHWFLRSADKYENEHVNSKRIVSMMLKYKDRTRWVFTNRMIFAFRSGIPAPPELVLSSKRMTTMELDETTAMELIRKYEPEQAVLVRMKWPLLDEYLKERYEALYDDEGKSFYVSKKLLSAGEAGK